MGNAGHNFYEALGIERAADERAIKKAYFALVRKYPPETHPEEFKRIREAYEVLSNPQSRADYDAVNQFDQYGAEVSARLQGRHRGHGRRPTGRARRTSSSPCSSSSRSCTSRAICSEWPI